MSCDSGCVVALVCLTHFHNVLIKDNYLVNAYQLATSVGTDRSWIL